MNTSTWNNSCADAIPQSVLLSTLMVGLSTCTVFGNALVIAAVVQFHRLRSTGNFLICSLATADLLVGLFVMPLHVVNRANGFWPLGLAACDFWHSLDVLASTASIWNLCVISLDRYLAVRDPLTYRSVMSVRRARLAVSCVWIFSALLAFPSIVWWRYASPWIYDNPLACRFSDSLSFLVLSGLVSFYIPLFIMVFAYCRVYIAAAMYEKSLRIGTKNMHRKKGIAGLEMRVHRGGTIHAPPSATREPSRTMPGIEIQAPPKDTLSVGGHSTCSESGNDSASMSVTATHQTVATTQGTLLLRATSSSPRLSQRGKASKQWNILQSKVNRFAREKKAAKTLGIVMGCFICCWCPFFIFTLIDSFWPDVATNGKTVFEVTTWLGYCNSCLNPVIYAWHNMEFRTAFTALLKRFCFCYKASTTSPTFSHNSAGRKISRTNLYGTIEQNQRTSSIESPSLRTLGSFRKSWSVRQPKPFAV